MDILKLARKLEPLMPNEVTHWLNSLDLVDEHVKDLIEKEIVYNAQKHLGNYRNKLLLSLPSKSKARGLFNLGTIVYEKDKWPIGISKQELLQNLAIFGRSGSGKTNVAFHLLQQLAQRKISFLFLDWKRTARHLLPSLPRNLKIYTPGRSLSPFFFNPLIPPPGLEIPVYLNQLVDVLAEAYTLGDGAKSVLQKALTELYKKREHKEDWPTIEELIHFVKAQPATGRATGWTLSAMRALESLSISILSTSRSTSPLNQHELVASFFNGNTIIELDALNQGAKKFLIPMLCLWLYYVRLAAEEREQLRLVLFVEEAHHVLYKQEHRSKESVMNMLLRQCRELGIGMVIIDQHPHLISTAALGNTYTSICMNQKDPSDINKAAALSLIETDEKKYFSMLPVGQGVIKLQDRWLSPVLIKFPLVTVRKGFVTDELLSRLLTRSLTLSDLKRAVNREFQQQPHFRLKDIVLKDSALSFLEDVMLHEHDGVDVRYKRLGWSADKGNRIKKWLVNHDILDEQQVKIGRTRRILLRVTQNARRELGLDSSKLQRGSISHEYWKRYYAQLFKEQGYQVRLEAPRLDGRVDVLAQKGGESVGIEVETGKSDVVKNVKQDLRARFTRVLIVATDEKAMTKVVQQLGKAGLIILGRVEIVLRDKLDMAKLASDLANEAEARSRAEASKYDTLIRDPKKKPPMEWPPWWYTSWWPCSQRTAIP